MRDYIILLTVLLAVNCLLSCTIREDCDSTDASGAYERLNEVLTGGEEVPSEAARAQLKDMSVEKRLDLLLYSRFCKDNGTVRNAVLFLGEDMGPAIIGRIESERRLYRKVEMMLFLNRIDFQCRCVNSRPDLMGRLRDEKYKLADNSIEKSDQQIVELFIRLVDDVEHRRDAR